MTRDQALELLGRYSNRARRVFSETLGEELEKPQATAPFCAISGVCGMRDRFPEDGSEAKAMRWLGFAQGVMVAAGVYTLDEVKEHSREVSHG